MENNVKTQEEQIGIKAYLSNYFDEEVLNKDAAFIEGKMDLDVNAEVKIKGFLVLPLIGATLGAFLNGIDLISNFKNYTILGLGLIFAIIFLQSASLYFTYKRKKLGKFTFLGSYIILIIISLLGNAMNVLLTGLLWSLYFLISKRVKYTFIK